MKDCLVSVVVPVYNTQDYLEECLDSILNQTYANLEIILVDDGSTDRAGQICDEYAKKDARVRVYHQENSGAARARKIGIQQAKGKYICFVDSDDIIKNTMIEYFVSMIGDADMITAGCDCERVDGSVFTRFDAFAEGTYRTEAHINYLIQNMIVFGNDGKDGFLPFLVTKMYRTEIVKAAVKSIDEKIIYAEDRDLLFRCILRCKSIVVAKDTFYFYRATQGSIMRSTNKNFMHDLNALYLSLEREFIESQQRESLIYQLQSFIRSRIYWVTRIMGFSLETRTVEYIFPYTNLLENKRYVLYGAGAVGMDYYRQVKNSTEGKLVLWVDRQWEKYTDSRFNVKPVEELQSMEFDCVLIAVKRKELADSIKLELLEKGIVEERIWWKPPINIEGI